MVRTAAVCIELLGRFQISRNGQAVAGASSRLQALIAYLILHRGKAISRQQLAFLFWTESSEAQARTNLRQLLHNLRGALPETDRYLSANHQTLCWQSDDDCAIDLVGFEQAAEAGQLEVAAQLYTGDLLPALYDEWLEAERDRLKRRFEDVLDGLIAAAEKRGDASGAIRYSEQRLARDPLREASYQTLMRLYATNGDRAGALRIYQQCADVLRRELAVEPGPATRRARDHAMEWEPAPAVASAGAPVRAPTKREMPLVGRDTEWRRLDHLWQRASSGHPALVVLTGEAGIGKTRLLEELIDHASAGGACTAHARCYEGDRALAYTAAADWLRSPALRPLIDHLPAAQRSQLARVLPEILADQTPPAPFTETWQKRHFFEALARAVLSPEAPVLLTIDDLQWSDPETIEWLHYLMRLDMSARLLVAATERIEDSADRVLLREQRMDIAIGPLSAAYTVKLGEQVTGRKAGSASLESLYERTRGNPLFVVETMRAGWSANEGVPQKVHSVITRRLARLSEPAQHVAGIAAVIGRPFTAELVGQVAGLAEDPAVQAMDELWKHGVLCNLEDGSYDFSHGCLRDVAYAAVGPARRKQLHRQIAESMESAGGSDADAVCGQIAGHFERAGLAARAIPWYRRAAEVVRRRFAEAEAIAYLTRALQLLETLAPSPDRDVLEVDLLLGVGLSYSTTQGYASEEAGRVYARARILCEVSRETNRYFGVLGGSWVFHIVRGELAISLEIAERYLALAQRESAGVHLAAGEFCAAVSRAHLGEILPALSQLERSVQHTRALSGAPPFLDFGPELGDFRASYMTHLLWLTGSAEEALERSRAAVAQAEGLNHPFSLALALAYAAMLHHFRDEPHPARERAEAAAALCRRYGFRYYLAWTPILIGWAQTRLGETEQGLAGMLQGINELHATGAALRAPYYIALAAQGCGECGRPEEGLRQLENAVRLGEASGERWLQPEVQRIKGVLLRQTGDHAGAEICFRNAVRLAKSMGAKAWEVRSITSSRT
jgi:DNA-binding SARP family transcriptional activator